MSSFRTTTPDSLRDLLKSLNDDVSVSRNVWIAFNTVLGFFTVSALGITHKDLFLNSPLALPIVDLKIPLSAYAVIAPIFILLIYFAVLVQHALLARKAIAFKEALKQLGKGATSEDLKQNVASYFFVKNILAPQQNGVIRFSNGS
jgi:hypothetical protein